MDALILAGGKSSRMSGFHKGNLMLGTQSFTERLLTELKPHVERLYLSYGSTVQGKYEDSIILQDVYQDCGPLGGLHAGLKVCDTVLLMAACDMPLLRWELYDFLLPLLKGYDAVVPMAEGRAQPLAALYTKALLPLVESALQSGDYRLMAVLKQANVRYVDVPQFAQLLQNINTEEDYRSLLNSL